MQRRRQSANSGPAPMQQLTQVSQAIVQSRQAWMQSCWGCCCATFQSPISGCSPLEAAVAESWAVRVTAARTVAAVVWYGVKQNLQCPDTEELGLRRARACRIGVGRAGRERGDAALRLCWAMTASMLPPDSNCRRALRSSFNLCHPHTGEKRLDSVSRYGC